MLTLSLQSKTGNPFSYKWLVCTHGESDEVSGNVSYEANLQTWRSNYDSDLVSVVPGQVAGSIVMVLSQENSWTSFAPRAYPIVAQQQLAVHASDPNVGTTSAQFLLACPKYMMAYTVGSPTVHMTTAGYEWCSDYYAKAIHAYGNGGWDCLRPLSVTLVGSTITVVFSKGGLVIDNSTVSDPSGTYASLSFGGVSNNVVNLLGFEFEDDTATAASASIIGLNGQGNTVASINANFGTTNLTGDTLTLQLSGTPTGANPRLRYAFTMTSGNNPGPTTGARGCLRDSDTSFTGRFGFTMYNWLPAMDYAA